MFAILTLGIPYCLLNSNEYRLDDNSLSSTISQMGCNMHCKSRMHTLLRLHVSSKSLRVAPHVSV